MTATEPATSEAPATMVATTSEASATTGMSPAKAAAWVTAPEASAAEMAAPAPAAEVTAEGRRIRRREHADRNRDGGGSEHGLECLADHGTLQYIPGRTVRFGNCRLDD
jgi:hypothetical protein